jgi:hypothetical protein
LAGLGHSGQAAASPGTRPIQRQINDDFTRRIGPLSIKLDKM